jgi:hypothetical protein
MIPLAPICLNGPWRIVLSGDRTKIEDARDFPAQPPVSWQKIQIRPGKLFTDRDGYLGYWQQVEIPGSVVDELLRLAKARLVANSGEWVAQLDEELARRRTRHQPGSDWDQLGRDLVRAAEQAARDVEKPIAEIEEWDLRLLACFDERSLGRLRVALSGGEGLKIDRSAGTLRLALPLTRRDAAGLAAVANAYEAALVRLAEARPEETMLGVAARVRGSVRRSLAMTIDGDDSCTISLDLVPVLNDLFEVARADGAKRFADDANSWENAKAMTMAVRGWKGADVQEGVDVAKLRRDLSIPAK